MTALCTPNSGMNSNDGVNFTLDGSHCDFEETLTDTTGDQFEYCCDNTSGLVLNNVYMGK